MATTSTTTGFPSLPGLESVQRSTPAEALAFGPAGGGHEPHVILHAPRGGARLGHTHERDVLAQPWHSTQAPQHHDVGRGTSTWQQAAEGMRSRSPMGSAGREAVSHGGADPTAAQRGVVVAPTVPAESGACDPTMGSAPWGRSEAQSHIGRAHPSLEPHGSNLSPYEDRSYAWPIHTVGCHELGNSSVPARGGTSSTTLWVGDALRHDHGHFQSGTHCGGLHPSGCAVASSHGSLYACNVGLQHRDSPDVFATCVCEAITLIPSQRIVCRGGSATSSKGDGQRGTDVVAHNADVLTPAHCAKAVAGAKLKPSCFATPDLCATLPLHFKHVGVIDWDVAEDLILPRLVHTWRDARRCYDASFLDELLRTTMGNTNNNPFPPAALSPNDIQLLHDAGFITRTCATNVRAWVKVFSVVEKSKNRRRFIAEPQINQWLTDPGEVRLPDHEQLRRRVTLDAAVCVDIPWYYGHFRLPIPSQAFFGFEAHGVTYLLCTLPTGSRQAPALAQALSDSIAERAVYAVLEIQQQQGGFVDDSIVGEVDITQDTYLDNTRFAGRRPAIHHALKKYIDICDLVGIWLDDEARNATASVDYVFLGVRFLHDTASVSLAEKTLTKLHEHRTCISQFRDTISIRDFLAVVGLCSYATLILGFHTAPFYIVYKFLRRRCGWALSASCHLWPCAVPVLCAWIDVLLENRPRIVAGPVTSRAMTLFTDACPSGWGAVLCDDQGKPSVRWSYGRFDQTEHIAVLEARALFYGVCSLPEDGKHLNPHVNIYIDNTSVQGAVQHGRSRNYTINNIVDDVLCLLQRKGYTYSLSYIPSAFNVADPLSRAHETPDPRNMI